MVDMTTYTSFRHSWVFFLLTTVVQAAANKDSCKSIITTSDVEGPFYTSVTPWMDRIAPEDQLQVSSNRLWVEGTVMDRNCQPLPNILVEPWYAGIPDDKGNLYSPTMGGDKRYRGRFYSNENGEYSYLQTFPEVYSARDIRHVHFKFSSASHNNHTLTTQMYFRDFLPAKYERYLLGRTSQIVDIIFNATTGERKVVLDVILDVEGEVLPHTTSAPTTVEELTETASHQPSFSAVPTNAPSVSAGSKACNGSCMAFQVFAFGVILIAWSFI